MAKIVKKKTKKSFRLLSFSIFLFIFSILVYFATALFLGSYNNSLSAKTQELNGEIATIELQNNALRVEIRQLSSSERVDDIAANNGMAKNQENIITLSKSETSDGE